jgi:hypothetical protein
MAHIGEAIKMMMIILQLVTSLGINVESTEIDGFKEQIYTVKASLNEHMSLTQQLAKNQVYGFETVVDMSKISFQENSVDKAENYYDIAVNGAFYSELGRPAGIMIIDKEIVTKDRIATPMFIIRDNGDMDFVKPFVSTYFLLNDQRFYISNINKGLSAGELNIYTKWNGTNNRIRQTHTAIVVEKGKVTSIETGNSPFSILGNNVSLLTNDFMICYKNINFDMPIQIGDTISYHMESNFDVESVKEGFQTGGWLVKDGINIVKDYESFLGPTNSLQPRTAIGITSDNKIIIKVVDGRDKGISEGVTGYQLANLLIEDGCIQAAYLDGGASSTFVQNGHLLNKPSLGEPKGVAHGLFFERDYQKVVAK